MGRLPGFDYKTPYYYMVTIKRPPHREDFSILEDGAIHTNAITSAFQEQIGNFHKTWYCIEPIRHFVIMPNHLHLLIKIRDIAKRVSLCVIVRQLIKRLTGAYWKALNTAPGDMPVFYFDWHDWIVLKRGQLAAFCQYIEENPRRAWLRRINREYFTVLRDILFAGRVWHAYGNDALLSLPVLEVIRCSRKWAENGPEWRTALGRASRIGPGGAGVGTFMSPGEKACGNAIFQTGGAFVVLRPAGFTPLWHPSRNQEMLCADGRMLFLSLYEPTAGRLDNATLYQRCHEMGDIITQALP